MIIFVLLVLAFRSIADSVLIMLSVPFALVGGVFLQWLLGYPMTTAVIIGYIALFAVAIQTGIIMIIFIRRSAGRRTEEQAYMDAVVDGSVAAAAAETDDGGGNRAVAAADHVLDRARHGDHEADRDAHASAA